MTKDNHIFQRQYYLSKKKCLAETWVRSREAMCVLVSFDPGVSLPRSQSWQSFTDYVT